MADIKLKLKQNLGQPEEPSKNKEEKETVANSDSTAEILPKKEEEKKVKLDLSALKKEQGEDNSTSPSPVVEEPIPASKDQDNNDTSEKEKKEEINSEEPLKNPTKITLGNIKKAPIEEPIPASKDQDNNDTSEKEKKEEISEELLSNKSEANESKMFGNYESHFEKKSQNFLDALRNFKTTPKTRFGMLVVLISLCIGSIGVLMIISPEKHSIQSYKGAIMQIYNSKFKDIPVEETTPYIPTPPQDKIPLTGSIDSKTPSEPITSQEPISQEEKVEKEKKKKIENFLLENYGK